MPSYLVVALIVFSAVISPVLHPSSVHRVWVWQAFTAALLIAPVALPFLNELALLTCVCIVLCDDQFLSTLVEERIFARIRGMYKQSSEPSDLQVHPETSDDS